MKKYKNIIILVNLLVLIFLMTKSIVKKEEILSNGKLVLLKLAPVDPRSLMQGDYMRLRYEISNDWRKEKRIIKRGYCVIKLNENNVAKLIRFQTDKAKDEGELLIPFTSDGWNISIGAESFFFQEGKGKKFEAGKYGALRIDDNGNTVLVGLYDKDLKEIK